VLGLGVLLGVLTRLGLEDLIGVVARVLPLGAKLRLGLDDLLGVTVLLGSVRGVVVLLGVTVRLGSVRGVVVLLGVTVLLGSVRGVVVLFGSVRGLVVLLGVAERLGSVRGVTVLLGLVVLEELFPSTRYLSRACWPRAVVPDPERLADGPGFVCLPVPLGSALPGPSTPPERYPDPEPEPVGPAEPLVGLRGALPLTPPPLPEPLSTYGSSSPPGSKRTGGASYPPPLPLSSLMEGGLYPPVTGAGVGFGRTLVPPTGGG